MNAELKQEWTTALRSGNYEQGQNALRKIREGAPTHCCLGVLCDLESRHSDARIMWDDDNEALGYDESLTGSLPLGYIREIGLTEEQEGKLIEMNDYGQSFAEIADWIDANL